MSLSTFIVNPELSVVCFRRDNCKHGPFFAVREFDIKVIRTRDKGRGRGRGPSEQAIRASIRQAILNMKLKSERATKAEIRQLKGHGILGKRAPSCSLLCAEDMIKLLGAFAKDSCVRDLQAALAKDRENCLEDNEKPEVGILQTKRKALRLHTKTLKPPGDCSDVLNRSFLFSKRPRLDCHKQNLSPLDLPRYPLINALNGLDALYSALLAFSNNEFASNISQESESSDALSPCSIPSPLSTSPSTMDVWSFPSPLTPSSPSSPVNDSHPRLRDTFDISTEEEIGLKPVPLSGLSLGLSFSTPTVLRPRRKKTKRRLPSVVENSNSVGPSETLSNSVVGLQQPDSNLLNLSIQPVFSAQSLQSVDTDAFQHKTNL